MHPHAQPLLCHPATPCGAALRLTVSLAPAARASASGWRLRYELRGNLPALRIPAPAAPGPADGLWQHTCFEAFVAVRGARAYREFNFSPSGQWAAYAFTEERVHDPSAEPALRDVHPVIDWMDTPESFVLQAWLPASAWPTGTAAQPLALGLSAVIETHDRDLSYWALHHPGPRPDFHHRGGFVLPTPPDIHGHSP